MKDYMHTHIHTEGDRDLPTFAGLNLNIRCFTIYQSGYKFDLSETRLPISHNRLLLIIPYRNIEIRSPYFPYASKFIDAQPLHPK